MDSKSNGAKGSDEKYKIDMKCSWKDEEKYTGMVHIAEAKAPDFTDSQRSLLISLAESGCATCIANGRSGEDKNADGKTWKLAFENPSLQLRVFSSESVGSKLHLHKAVCIIPNISPDDLCDFISNLKHRLTWDRNLVTLTAITIDDQSYTTADGRRQHKWFHMLRSCTKSIGPISGREFIDSCLVMHLDNGSIVCASTGLTPEQSFDKFPMTKDRIRGINERGSGWLFEKYGASGNDCKLTYTIQCDLKGWFTPMLINNAIGGSYTAFFEDLRAALLGQERTLAIERGLEEAERLNQLAEEEERGRKEEDDRLNSQSGAQAK